MLSGIIIIDYYCTHAGLWTSPSTTGQKPPPIANFTFTGVNSHRAVLFGGRQRQCRSSDLFIVDFDPEKVILHVATIRIYNISGDR